MFKLIKNSNCVPADLQDLWQRWFFGLDTLHQEMAEKFPMVSPLESHKSAAVSFLASGAARAGQVPLLGHGLGRREPLVRGDLSISMADLIIEANGSYCSMEFRRTRRQFNLQYLLTQMQWAIEDTNYPAKAPLHYGASCLWGVPRMEDVHVVCREFAVHLDVDFSCTIGLDDKPTYFFLRLKTDRKAIIGKSIASEPN